MYLPITIGAETGRQCLLAILDSRITNKETDETRIPQKDEFKPTELVRSLINLPEDFLCNSGYIYETVFQRPPISVVKEALQMLVQKAYEKSPSSLGVEQINLAIKQLRLDNLGGRNTVSEDGGEAKSKVDKEDVLSVDDVKPSTVKETASTITSSAAEEAFRLQIMIELIRMHVVAANNKNTFVQPSLGITYATSKVVSDTYKVEPDNSDDEADAALKRFYSYKQSNFADLPIPPKPAVPSFSTQPPRLFSSIGTASITPANSIADMTNTAMEEQQQQQQHGLDIPTIERHLRTPLTAVNAQAQNMSSEALEDTNNLLKPYLKQLASLKTSLTAQLKELQDSRAYLALGISSAASDDAIKKAYRAMAIRLHPDKPGGDTARFQQLQDAYYEVLKKRKADSAQKLAMDEVIRKHKNTTGTATNNNSTGKTKATRDKDGNTSSTSSSSVASEQNSNRNKSRNTNIIDSDDDEDGDMVDDDADKERRGKKDSDDINKASNNINNVDAVTNNKEEEEEVSSKTDSKKRSNSTETTIDDECSEDNNKEISGGGSDSDDNGSNGDDDDFDIADMLRDEDLNDEELLAKLGIKSRFSEFARVGEDGDVTAQFYEEFGSSSSKYQRVPSSSSSEKKIAAAATTKIYDSEEEHAKDIELQIGTLLQRIKGAAAICTELAQLNIKWQKLLDKAMNPSEGGGGGGGGCYPQCLKEVYKLITASSTGTGSKSLLKSNRSSKSAAAVSSVTTPATAATISNMDACALQQAIAPVEQICEWAQQVSALAMELPNSCGVRYASAAANNRAFLSAIERSMQLSLGALKTVLSLINAHEQLASCARRVKDSLKLAADNKDIHDLLLEMVRTGVRSNVITITNTG